MKTRFFELDNAFEPDPIRELTVRMLRAPSPQTELFEREPLVLDFISKVVAPELSAMGIDRIEIDGMGNLIGRVGDGRSGRRLVYVAYAMTAAPGVMDDPYSGKSMGGTQLGKIGECLWGRGACEQKGPLAAMLAALSAIVQSRLKLDGELIFILSTAGETGRHTSIEYILGSWQGEINGKLNKHARLNENVTPSEKTIVGLNGEITGLNEGREKLGGGTWDSSDKKEGPLGETLGIIGLGTDNAICLGNKGRIDIRVTVKGKACHSSTPWEGVDAIGGACRFLGELETSELSLREHPHLGRSTITPIGIESFPKATHTVQDRCELLLDRRLVPGEDPEEAYRQVEELAGRLSVWGRRGDNPSNEGSNEGSEERVWPGELPKFAVKPAFTVKKGPFMYPSEVARGSTVARLMEKAIKKALGRDPRFIYMHVALDAGYMNRMGIQTVMFGPGDVKFAHTGCDIVELEQVIDAAKVYAYAALTYLVDAGDFEEDGGAL